MFKLWSSTVQIFKMKMKIAMLLIMFIIVSSNVANSDIQYPKMIVFDVGTLLNKLVVP